MITVYLANLPLHLDFIKVKNPFGERCELVLSLSLCCECIIEVPLLCNFHLINTWELSISTQELLQAPLASWPDMLPLCFWQCHTFHLIVLQNYFPHYARYLYTTIFNIVM